VTQLQLTIHRGTHEVGGTCIEVSTGKTRIVLDIGLPLFDQDREPFDSFSLRRKSKEELQADGLLPQVSGLFDDSPTPDAILLSHAHLDHTGLLGHSRPEIPVYASSGTSKMMLAGGIFSGQVSIPRDRFREIQPEKPIKIGDFTVTAFPVDHSIFGCLAYLIEADGKSILYSGDLRLHGRKTGMAKRLAEVLSNRTIDVMLMEGTHFGLSDGNKVTEYELEDEIVKHVSEASGFVATYFSPQHVDRLVAFIRAAKKTGRTFVADVYTAFILYLIASEIPVPVPGKDDLVRVFYPKTFVESAERRGLKKLSDRFEASRISMEEIIAEPSKHLMIFRPSMLQPDFEGTLPSGTTLLYSSWSGYLDKPDWKTTAEKLKAADGKLIEVHTSGHILSTDIVRFVESISPAMIVPVHTFEPKTFQQHFENVKLLSDGESWTVG
jgi:ribonuclease J